MTREARRRERDRKLIRAMARHGIVDPRTTLRVARRVNRERGHMPLSRACALLEKESGGGANVWGHDQDRHGRIPPFGGPVTRRNYSEYLRRRRKDGRQQGCGPTQLTFFAFQDEADRHGGCWRPNINMYVGFTHLAMNIEANGVHAGMRRYNGSGPAAEAYARDLRKREARWRAIFDAAIGARAPGRPRPPIRTQQARRRPAAAKPARPPAPRPAPAHEASPAPVQPSPVSVGAAAPTNGGAGELPVPVRAGAPGGGGSAQAGAAPVLGRLIEQLTELDGKEDKIRALLLAAQEDLEATLASERRARRAAEARLRAGGGQAPARPPARRRQGARPKARVRNPNELRARAERRKRSHGARRKGVVDKRWSKNRLPHRRLVVGSRGLDVAQLQHALNRRLKARAEFGFRPIEADGEFGPVTRRAWLSMARAIGLSHAKCTVGNQILMRNPARRGPSAVKKGRAWLARARAALRREQATGGAGGKAVAFLVKRAGWTERPFGSNDARFLANWRRALNMGWMRGQPWCGFACQAAYHFGAGKRLPADTPSTIAIANRARSGNGYTRVGLNSIKAGDLVVFHMGSGGPKHVGLARGPMRNGVVPTVEGNTSAGNAGSQANGGGIFLRTRSRGLIHTVARPK